MRRLTRLLLGSLTGGLSLGAAEEAGVQWRPLLQQSGLFLGIQHGFRLATEPGTRSGMRGSFFRGWHEAVTSLHGWADGDPFLVNYIGHPMQGAVASYIWVQNDPQYRNAQFGRSPLYWKSRLRAAAFSWAYSAQFEVGPLSEASLGKVQNFHPQQGFVDHVVTPAAGLLWTVGEDAIDREIIQRLEDRISSPWARAMFRAGLNPSRSFANALRFKVPWHRDTRGWRAAYRRSDQSLPPTLDQDQEDGPPRRDRFQLMTAAAYTRLRGSPHGSSNCIGASVAAVFTITDYLSLVGRADGCKLFHYFDRMSGDSLAFSIGPRVVWNQSGRLTPFVEALAGVQRITIDELREGAAPAARTEDKRWVPPPPSRAAPFAKMHQAGGFLLSSGAGLSLNLHKALAVHLAEVNYSRAWLPAHHRASYSSAVRVSMGLTLRAGAW